MSNNRSSDSSGFGAVRSLSPKKIELAPAKKQSACPSRVRAVRPALSRTRARGRAIRVVAMSRTSSNTSTGFCPARGVPSCGMRQLIGTLSGAGSKPHRTSSILSRSCSDSPIPRIAPQQTAIPAFCTERMVRRRSSNEWVVTMLR